MLAFYMISGKIKRKSRRRDRSISKTIYKTTKGFENVVNAATVHFVNGLGSIIRKSENISQTIDQFVSSTLNDIDNRLNQPKKNYQKR